VTLLNDKKHLLIVEDDRRLSYINSRALEVTGYEVHTAFTLAEARQQLSEAAPDVILLDVKLPDGSGVDFCREIRTVTSAYIIFLTSVSDYDSELDGLLAGGDDYLRKPYGIDLLRARVAKGLRQNLPPGSQVISRGPLELHIMSAQAFLNDQDMLLTQKEFALLLLLVQNEEKTLSKEFLYETVWNQPVNDDARAVKAHLSNVRKKLSGSGYSVTVSRGEGYCFEKSFE